MSKKWMAVIAVVSVIIFSQGKSQNIRAEFSEATIQLAAQNIILQITHAGTKSVILVNSEGKSNFAEYLASELDHSSRQYRQVVLADTLEETALLQEIVANHEPGTAYILLITPNHAHLLFSAIGRPDIGLKLPEGNLVCDWLARIETTIRTYAIDYQENIQFQEALLKALNTAIKIQITSAAGTDITLSPRNWKTIHGEVFTAPIQLQSNGVIVIDACAYWGPPPRPIRLVLKNGRVLNINELDRTLKQQEFMINDLNTDENSSLLGELGIGTNLGAEWNKDLLESEQARGTCHFGFGLNTSFGGENSSGIHVDYVIKDPTIIVDNKVICENGVFGIQK